MKLAILTHNYPSDDNRTAGVFVVDHDSDLRSNDASLSTTVHNFPFGEYPLTAAIKKPWKWPKFFFYFLFLPSRVRRAIAKADAVLAHWWLPAGIAAAMVCGEKRLEVICHGTDLYILRKMPWLARLFSPLTTRVDHWQCVSNDLKELLLTLYPIIDQSHVSVKPMPVGREFGDLGLPRPGDQLVSCGALIKRKRFDVLIREMAKVPDVHLKIFGEGPERPRLETLVKETGLADRVELPGNVSRDDLNKAFNQASLFVLLSVDEGFGMVLKESQKAGCPTMALASGGMIDTGLDYPLEPDEDVAGRIREVLDR